MKQKQHKITVAICCFNGAPYIANLLEKLAALDVPITCEILVIDNNSTDETPDIVKQCIDKFSRVILYVREPRQGIAFARNRAVDESRQSQYLAFIDVDELPHETWLVAAINSLKNFTADCVGGEITLTLPHRPSWLCDDLLPFLGKVDHGQVPFRIADTSTPVWSGNIAYDTAIFEDGLRFDTRYNREGDGVGGGEDAIMLRTLLEMDCLIYYVPDMRIAHLIPDKKLTQRYFYALHFTSGKRKGLYELPEFSRKIAGVPLFLFLQALKQASITVGMFLRNNPQKIRQCMNTSHAFGIIYGYYLRGKPHVRYEA